MTDEIILHNYPNSPFSEKIRVAFGIKGLAWRSVIQPVIMPKPDLIPLTGGYRKIPVLQIGADIYCDTQIILRELERRFPTPSLSPQNKGAPYAIGFWADRQMFQAAVAIIFGEIGDFVPEDFKKDRAAMSGGSFSPRGAQARRAVHARPVSRASGVPVRPVGGRAAVLGRRPGGAGRSPCLHESVVREQHAAAQGAGDDGGIPRRRSLVRTREGHRPWRLDGHDAGRGARHRQGCDRDGAGSGRSARSQWPQAGRCGDGGGRRLRAAIRWQERWCSALRARSRYGAAIL
ncbi:MAG: glutathione S-transferase N-terminal domain-containing protein [Rhizomicrobium sp.]